MEASSTHRSAISVVIGYGNPIRQDDAMGWKAAQLLQRALPPHAVEIVQEHQLTPELVTRLKQARLAIFLDASVNLSPGAIRLQTLYPAKMQPWSHHILPDQLLTLAEQVNGEVPPAYLISGGVEEMGLSDRMTGTGEKCAARIANLARHLVLG
jgi:hydrogenase maturation protease